MYYLQTLLQRPSFLRKRKKGIPEDIPSFAYPLSAEKSTLPSDTPRTLPSMEDDPIRPNRLPLSDDATSLSAPFGEERGELSAPSQPSLISLYEAFRQLETAEQRCLIPSSSAEISSPSLDSQPEQLSRFLERDMRRFDGP